MLGQYAYTLMAIADASSENARAEAGQTFVEVTQQIETHGREIARVVLELLGHDLG